MHHEDQEAYIDYLESLVGEWLDWYTCHFQNGDLPMCDPDKGSKCDCIACRTCVLDGYGVIK